MTRQVSDDQLLDIHDKEGIKRYGVDRWNRANIGWYSGDKVISSKVYGDPCMILTTAVDETNHIYHIEERYRY